MKDTTYLLTAIALAAGLASCAPALRPQQRWDAPLISVQSAPDAPPVEPLDVDWLNDELSMRGVVGGTAGPAVVRVESLKGAHIYMGQRYYVRGSIWWPKTGRTISIAGDGMARNAMLPARAYPRARADAIRRAVCTAVGMPID